MPIKPSETFLDKPDFAPQFKSKAAALALSFATLLASACNQERQDLPTAEAVESVPDDFEEDTTPVQPVPNPVPTFAIPTFDFEEGSGDELPSDGPTITLPALEGETYDQMITRLLEKHCSDPEIRKIFDAEGAEPTAVRLPEIGLGFCFVLEETMRIHSTPSAVILEIDQNTRRVLAELFHIDLNERPTDEAAYVLVETIRQLQRIDLSNILALDVAERTIIENAAQFSPDLTVFSFHIPPNFDPNNLNSSIIQISVATVTICQTHTNCDHPIDFDDCEIYDVCETEKTPGLIASTPLDYIGVVFTTVSIGDRIIISPENLEQIRQTLITDDALNGQ